MSVGLPPGQTWFRSLGPFLLAPTDEELYVLISLFPIGGLDQGTTLEKMTQGN